MDDDKREKISRAVRIGVPVIVVCGIAGAIWYMMHDTAGVKREAPPLPTLLATLPPPPPPPPPPKEKPPEPEKKVEEVRKIEEQPKQESPPKQMTVNGPAQAGTDAFGLGAGDGSGSVGSSGGYGDASYSRYLGSALQEAVQQDSRVNHLVFAAQLDIWVDQDGRVRAKLVRPTGDDKIDQILVADCESTTLRDETPPPSLQFPARVAVQGRRPGSQT